MRRHGGLSLCDVAGEERAGQGEGTKGARLLPVRQGPGSVGQCLSAPVAPDRIAGGDQGKIPARQRLCPRQERGLGQNDGGEGRLHRGLSRAVALKELWPGRIAGPQSPMSKKTFIAFCFLPLAILVTAFF